MDKATLEKNQYLIAGGILLLIVLVFYVMFVVMPLLKQVMQLSNEEKGILSQLDSTKNVFDDKDKLAKEIKAIKESIKYFEKCLPEKSNIPEVLEGLIKMGKKSDVNFVSIEPLESDKIQVGEGSNVSTYLQIPIALLLRGGYHPIGKFFNLVECSGRFMEIDTFSIIPDPNAPGEHIVRLTVSSYSLSTKGE